MSDQSLPAKIEPGTVMEAMPIGMRVIFDQELNAQIEYVAKVMSQGEITTPKHLRGKPHACYAVVVKALTWKLDPFSVANCTYETPGGQLGYEGKLIQAVIENSGMVEGNVKFELFGNWDKVRNKFEIKKSRNGKDYPAQGWSDEDEEGLGVKVSVQVKNEVDPREESFLLRSMWPRNSTLWALRPEQQIKYAAVRAFGNTVCPGILMGVPFEGDLGAERMVDITPPEAQITDPLERAYQAGWNAQQQGVRYRDAPGNLKPDEHEHWLEGWKASLKNRQDPDGIAEKEAQTDGEDKQDVEDTKETNDGSADPQGGETAVAEGVERFSDPGYAQGIIAEIEAATDQDTLGEVWDAYEDDREKWPEAVYRAVSSAFEAADDKFRAAAAKKT